MKMFSFTHFNALFGFGNKNVEILKTNDFLLNKSKIILHLFSITLFIFFQLIVFELHAQQQLQIIPKVYIFNGNGNWSKVTNWQGSIKPPGLVPKGDSILVQTAPGDTCVLDVAQFLAEGAVLKVVDGGLFIIKNGIVKFVPADSSFTDSRDGKKYPIKKYGNQIWMTMNLNYNQAGSKIYDDNPVNAAIYGRLYTWNQAKNAIPAGWHLPTVAEWSLLNTFLGSGVALRDTVFWLIPGTQASNSSGFSARPGGLNEGYFDGMGEWGIWWTSTLGHSELGVYHWAWAFWLGSTDNGNFWEDRKEWFEAIRCVKD